MADSESIRDGAAAASRPPLVAHFEVRERRAVALERAGNGPTWLLLHGAGGNHHSYDELLPYLGTHHCVIPALPGRCGSDGSAPCSVEQAGDWLVDFVRAARLGPVILCGHSYGGALAIDLALRHPGALEVRALLLMATGARLRVSPSILRLTEAAIANGEALALGSFAFRDGSDQALMARVDMILSATPATAADADWRAADTFDRMAAISQLRVPTLVMTGSDDLLTPPKYARFLADNIPGAALELVAGAGHMLPFESPAATGERLRRFVDALR